MQGQSLTVNLFVGIALGANVVIAHAIGQGDKNTVKKAVHTSILVSLLGGVLVAALGELAAAPLLRLLQVPDDVFPLALLYLRIYLLGMPVILLYNFEAAIFRSVGETKIPLLALAVSGVVNVALNLFFVAVLGMTVNGVAIATVISNALSSAILYFRLRTTAREVHVEPHLLRIDLGILKRILRIGLPAGIQSGVFSLANIIIQSAINSLGTVVMAASSAAFNIKIFTYDIVNAFGQACTTFVGQNFGAGDRERVHESIHKGLLIHLTTSALFSVIIFSGRYPMMHLFVGDDPTVIAIGAQVTALIAPCYVLFTLVEVLSATMRGVGDAVVPAAITMVFTCIVRLIYLWGYAFSHNSNLTIAVIYPISWVLTSIAFLLYYKSRKWMPKGFHF